MTRSIAVLSAGLSNPSATRLLADRLGEAAEQALTEQGDHAEVHVVELRSHARDLADNLVTGFPNRELRRTIETTTSADGVVAVTPVFSASYSGLFKTFFDVLDKDALAGTPVLMGATAGTARHSLVLEHALRPLFSYLRAVVVPTGVFAAPEDWASGGPTNGLASRIERAASEFAALVVARPRERRADPFDEPVPFEQLLAGG